MTEAVHLDFDGAWEGAAGGAASRGAASLGMPTRDLRSWGPRLRYCAPSHEVEAFDAELGDVPPFVLYGSGDFHYLAALWVRRARRRLAVHRSSIDGPRLAVAPQGHRRLRPPTNPVPRQTNCGEPLATGSPVQPGQLTVVSFDNHPDWDVRPPRWACGGWLCRALEMPHVRGASVWGCGNFELAWPSRLFANHQALRSGRLKVHAWAERQKPAVCRRFDCMSGQNWREQFQRFAGELTGTEVYVTVDLDCLRAAEAVTNWENGLFTADDVAWAIGRLRAGCQVVGGDLCGAYSPPAYARWRQRFAGNWDHPKLPPRDRAEARRVNRAALEKIWPALIGE